MTLHPVVPLWAWAPLAVGGVAACVVLGWRSGRRAAAVRRGAAVLLLALVALRPGSIDEAVPVASDLDVWFVVDRTASMVAEDQAGWPNRLDAAKQDVLTIADGLPGSRFALVGFDNDVVDLMPLTTDVDALAVAVDVLHPEVTSYSTGSSPRLPAGALQRRLADAAELDPERRRVVVLFSDGEATADEPTEDSFAPLADLLDGGAVLGYGTRQGGWMREWSGSTAAASAAYVRDPRSGSVAVSRIDEATLQAIADEMDVTYVHRASRRGVEEIIDALGTGPREGDQDGTLTVAQDRGWVLAWPLLGLVLVELALASSALARAGSVGPRRRAP